MVLMQTMTKDHQVAEVRKVEAVFVLPDGTVRAGAITDQGLAMTVEFKPPEGGMVVIT